MSPQFPELSCHHPDPSQAHTIRGPLLPREVQAGASPRGAHGAPLPLQNPTRAQTHSQLGLAGKGTCLLLAGSSGFSLKLGSARKPSPQQPGSSAFLFPPLSCPHCPRPGTHQISRPRLISHLSDSRCLFLVALPLSLTSLLPPAHRQLTGILPIAMMADPGRPFWPSEN